MLNSILSYGSSSSSKYWVSHKTPPGFAKGNQEQDDFQKLYRPKNQERSYALIRLVLSVPSYYHAVWWDLLVLLHDHLSLPMELSVPQPMLSLVGFFPVLSRFAVKPEWLCYKNPSYPHSLYSALSYKVEIINAFIGYTLVGKWQSHNSNSIWWFGCLQRKTSPSEVQNELSFAVVKGSQAWKHSNYC